MKVNSSTHIYFSVFARLRPNSINSLPIEREFEFKQLSDPNLRIITNELEFRDDKYFHVIDGLLYRKRGDSLFIVPESITT